MHRYLVEHEPYANSLYLRAWGNGNYIEIYFTQWILSRRLCFE